MSAANEVKPMVVLDEAINARILEWAQARNSAVLARFATAAADLEAGNHRSALGAIDGVDGEIQNLRCLLRLMQSK